MLHALLKNLQIKALWFFQQKLLPIVLATWKRVKVGSSRESIVWCRLQCMHFVCFFVILLYWDGLMFFSLSSLHQDVLLHKNNIIELNFFFLSIWWKCITKSASTKTSDNLCGNTIFLNFYWKHVNNAFTSSRMFKTHAAQVIIDCAW